MDTPPTVAELIDKWDSVSAWARDIGLKRESHGTVMKMRGRIPVIYWPAMIASAARHGYLGVSNDTLAAAHAAIPARPKKATPVQPERLTA